MKLGGHATISELTDEYNKLHFPRNTNYKDLSTKEVRKTMQGDVSKLIRDRTIQRIIIRPKLSPANYSTATLPRLVTTFKITEYGWKVIDGYRLSQVQQVSRL